MTAIIVANNIYSATGKALWPWEVDELPDEWLDAFAEFSQGIPKKVSKRGSKSRTDNRKRR